MPVLRDQKRIKEIAEGIYGPERVELESRGSSAFDLTIHFPEVVIENNRHTKHYIKDLWVRFSTSINSPDRNNNYALNVRPTGRRTTASLKEIQSGYAHSHLSRNESFLRFQNFCLGQSQYASIIDNLRINGTEEDWELALLSLPNYVKWESLEGGPYIRMSDISYQSSRSIVAQTTQQDLEMEVFRLMPHIPKEVWEFTPHLTLLENHPALYDFFNTYSNIRRLVQRGEMPGITEEVVLEAQRRLRNSQGGIFQFNGKNYPFVVYDESIANIESTTNALDREVFTKYIAILKSYSINKSKQFLYESVKQRAEEHYRALSPFK